MDILYVPTADVFVDAAIIARAARTAMVADVADVAEEEVAEEE